MPPGGISTLPRCAAATITADATGVITAWNADAAELTGFGVDEIVGMWALADLFDPPLGGVGGIGVEGPTTVVHAGPVACRHARLDWRTVDAVAVRTQPTLRGPAGGTTVVCRPLAEPPDASVLPTSVVAGELLRKAAHELRSPVSGIIGLARVMLLTLETGRVDGTRQAQQLTMVQAGAQRSLRLVEDLVDAVRLETEPTPGPATTVDCAALLGEVLAAARPEADRRGVRLHVSVPDRPVVLHTDAAQLAAVVRELVGNAIRFTDGDQVTVGLRDADDTITIDVRDDGPGIALTEQARIFAPFERGERAVELDDGGTGMGLHLACRRAYLLRAGLTVSSRPQEGSTFTLRVPRGAAPMLGGQ